jgi:hypothetical protein
MPAGMMLARREVAEAMLAVEPPGFIRRKQTFANLENLARRATSGFDEVHGVFEAQGYGA